MQMVTVYILGHKVGDLEEPVLYVKRKVYDYDDREILKGIPDKFIDSLTHDCIIVQVPYLKGRFGNRLEKTLSVFDQSYMTEDDSHIMKIDEGIYESDSDLKLIIHRLTAAAADAGIRHEMNVEDEYFGLIEEKDTTIMEQNKVLAEQGAQLKEQDAQLKEQDIQLKEQDARLKEQDIRLKEQDARLKERNVQLKEKDSLLEEKEQELRKKEVLISSLLKKVQASGADNPKAG